MECEYETKVSIARKQWVENEPHSFVINLRKKSKQINVFYKGTYNGNHREKLKSKINIFKCIYSIFLDCFVLKSLNSSFITFPI